MSNIGQLEQLAEAGTSAVPVDAWPELASCAWQQGVADGDARYCVLSVMLTTIEDWWSRLGRVPQSIAQEIDGLLKERLPAVLEAEEPADGARLAEELRATVAGRLEPSDRWEELGYVRGLGAA